MSPLKTGKLACIAVALAIFLVGCGNMTKGKSAAEAGVVAFHSDFDAQNYSAIASAADPQMFKSATKDGLVTLLGAIHNKLGNVTTSQNTEWKVQTYNMDTMVILSQDTKFQNGDGTETFVFRIAGGKAKLLSYSINSKDLTLK